MSEKIRDVMVYLLKHHSDGLANTMMNDLVYLADWYHAKEYGQQITDIKWERSKKDKGPFVFDIQNTAEEYPKILKTDTESVPTANYDGDKTTFHLIAKDFLLDLSVEEKKFLGRVIKESKEHKYKFHTHVQETPPLQNAKPKSPLNLVEKAKG